MAPLSHSRGAAQRQLFLFCSHPVVERHLLRILQRSDFQIVVCRERQWPEAEFPSAATSKPLVIVDGGEDARSSLELVCTLRILQSQADLLVLLPRLEDEIAHSLLRLGVKGLLTYRMASSELVDAARHVAAGEYWVSQEILGSFLDSILPELRGRKSLEADVRLSRREREVLDLLLENLSNKEIAGKLFVAERTVKFHVSNLLSKFRVARRSDLIIQWMQRRRDLPLPEHDFGRPLSAHIN